MPHNISFNEVFQSVKAYKVLKWAIFEEKLNHVSLDDAIRHCDTRLKACNSASCHWSHNAKYKSLLGAQNSEKLLSTCSCQEEFSNLNFPHATF